MPQANLFFDAPDPSCVLSVCNRYRYSLRIPLADGSRAVRYVPADELARKPRGKGGCRKGR